MSQVHLHMPSFNAGELSPLLGARFGVEKVQSGCRRLRNFIIHTHGPVFRRPGMEFIGDSAGKGSRLLPFNFSTETSLVLELHPSGLKVWKSDGTQATLSKLVSLRDYSEEECQQLQVAQVNDVCYMAHPDHPPRRLVRLKEDPVTGVQTWELQEIKWKWPPLGDEHVDEEQTRTATQEVKLSAPTYQWPEFTIPKKLKYKFEVVNPDQTTAQKKAIIDVWGTNANGDPAWVPKKVLSWTVAEGSPPTPDPFEANVNAKVSQTFRLRYSGPLKADCVLKVTWTGVGVSGEFTMPVAAKLPEIENEISVLPKGEYEITLQCPPTVKKDQKVILQKRKPDKPWANEKSVLAVAGKTLTVRGEIAEADAGKEFRFHWPHVRAMMGGHVSLETLTYSPGDGLTLSVNELSGVGRTLTATEPMFTEDHIGSYWQLTHRRDQSMVQIITGPKVIVAQETPPIRVFGRWEVHTYGTWTATLELRRKTGENTFDVVRSWTSTRDRNVIANGEEATESELYLRISAGTANYPDTPADSKDKPRFVLEIADTRINGLVKITAVPGLTPTNRISATATVEIVSPVFSTAPTSQWTEGAWSKAKGHPGTVTLHGQRLWFGGSKEEPLRLWGSVVNDYENFQRSSLDDASVSFTPAAQQRNEMRWITSHGTDLVFGTTGDEWTLSGGTEGGPITPSNVLVQRRSAYGSAYLPSLMLGEVVVFVQRGAQKLRQVAPQATGIVWSAADLTVLAEHIARAGVKQLGVMTFPSTILWAVTGDGKLIGMTFEQEQNVFGWHAHDTDGFVESVAVIYGEESDQVWLAVSRANGRYIERLDPKVFARQFHQHAKLMYLDSAKRYDFARHPNGPQNVLDGLKHLEGREVSVLGDGAELSPVRVINQKITIERAVTNAVVGLPFSSELQPMRLEVPMQDGTAQHRMWRTTRVGLLLHESLGGEIADGPEARFERLQFRRISTPMDSAPALFSGQIETAIESKARENADIVIRQTSPLPLNLAGITLKGDIYGE